MIEFESESHIMDFLADFAKQVAKAQQESDKKYIVDVAGVILKVLDGAPEGGYFFGFTICFAGLHVGFHLFLFNWTLDLNKRTYNR